MGGFCHRCGDCCDGITVGWSMGDMEALLGREPENPDALFVTEHWHKTGEDGDYNVFTCDRFDADTRLCTAHDDRPPICRDFPWYGRDPDEQGRHLSKRCGYWYDVPADERPENVLPLLEVA